MKGKGQFGGGKCWASHCNQWGLCDVVILCRMGWHRGSSQITSGFLVLAVICSEIVHSCIFGKYSYVSTKLPTTARKNGVRIRWWQPRHSGQSRADWIVDEIVIGGKEVNPNEVNDDFGAAGRRTVNWLTMAGIRYDKYCGAPYAAVGQSAPGERVVLTTSDVTVAHGDVIEFSIAIGCGANDGAESAYPVYLDYSVDYGVSWHLVRGECLPSERGCGGKARTASIFFQTGRFRRVVIPLPSDTVSPYVRL